MTGALFVREESSQYGTKISASNNVKYDLIGKLVDETGLTRKSHRSDSARNSARCI